MSIFKEKYQKYKIQILQTKRRLSTVHVILIMILLLVVLVGLFLFSTFGQNEKSYELTSTAMGTYIKQTVYSDDGQSICDEAFKQITKLEKFISWRAKGSEIDNINKNAGGLAWTEVNDMTLKILSTCKNVYDFSGGAYDPTILSISSLWNFGGKKQRVPTTGELNEALKHVGSNSLKINFDLNRVKLFTRGSGIDLGSAEKGAACNVAVEVYKKLKSDRAIISIGGNIGVYGMKKNGKPWNIAIKDPFDKSDAIKNLAVIKITNGFVSTTDVYEKSFVENDQFYHHILDPRTGYPVENNIASVTVLHQDGIVANILSTACYVIGKDKSLELLNKFDAQAVIVTKDKNIYKTKDVKCTLLLADDGYKINDLS